MATLAATQVQASVEELPSPDQSTEIVLAIEVVEHVVQPEVALIEALIRSAGGPPP